MIEPKPRKSACPRQPYYVIVGRNIRRLRLKRRWPQRVLALHVGVTQNFIARLERGEAGCALVIARNICDALEVSVDAIAYEKYKNV